MQYNYEERYVAFIDILGFSDRINCTIEPQPTVTTEDVVQALEVPQETKINGVILGRIGDISASKHTLTAFSDCVTISTSATEQGLMNLLFHVRAIVFNLLKLKFLTRGGIAKGFMYHHDGKVFGPAMLKAYNLEHEVAVFPRVVIQPEVVEAGLKAEPPGGQVFKQMVKCDQDDLSYMVHSLWALRMVADSEMGFVGENLELVRDIKGFLSNEETRLALGSKKVEKICRKVGELEKVQWFRQYFDWATDRKWVDEIHAPYPT